MRAEAQDGANAGAANNANMSTGSDGTSPRMQMYVWSGPASATVTVNGVDYPAGTASFGPQTFDMTDQMAIASPPQACTAPPSWRRPGTRPPTSTPPLAAPYITGTTSAAPPELYQ